MSTTERLSTLGRVSTTERVNTLGCVSTTARSHPQNAVKTGHFVLAAEKAPSTWIIDSGASHHMYNRHETRQALRSYDGHETGRVLTSNNGSREYNNKNFRSILAVRGTAFEPCPPQRQHKNGITERMIGVLT